MGRLLAAIGVVALAGLTARLVWADEDSDSAGVGDPMEPIGKGAPKHLTPEQLQALKTPQLLALLDQVPEGSIEHVLITEELWRVRPDGSRVRVWRSA